MNKRRVVYEGKAKILYEGPEPGTLVQYFKDDTPLPLMPRNAPRAGWQRRPEQPHQRIHDDRLAPVGIPTHFIRRLNMREQLIKKVEIIPLEVVVRNVAAGSMAKRLGIEEGTPAAPDRRILLQERRAAIRW
jgi:phosphoribosylaminoimidazole-succinocarboxamide synthase